MKKIVPWGLRGAPQSWPPCELMIHRQMERPIPIPCVFVVKKASKIRSKWFGSIPVPESSTVILTLSMPIRVDLIVKRRSRSVIELMASTAFMMKVEKNLLQRHPLANYIRKLLGQLALQQYLMTFSLSVHQSEYLANERVHVD